MGYDRGDSFLLILNRMELHFVQNRKENCHHDHIPFNTKGNGHSFLSVYLQSGKTTAIRHNCQRGWRLSASWGPNGLLLKPLGP